MGATTSSVPSVVPGSDAVIDILQIMNAPYTDTLHTKRCLCAENQHWVELTHQKSRIIRRVCDRHLLEKVYRLVAEVVHAGRPRTTETLIRDIVNTYRWRCGNGPIFNACTRFLKLTNDVHGADIGSTPPPKDGVVWPPRLNSVRAQDAWTPDDVDGASFCWAVVRNMSNLVKRSPGSEDCWLYWNAAHTSDPCSQGSVLSVPQKNRRCYTHFAQLMRYARSACSPPVEEWRETTARLLSTGNRPAPPQYTTGTRMERFSANLLALHRGVPDLFDHTPATLLPKGCTCLPGIDMAKLVTTEQTGAERPSAKLSPPRHEPSSNGLPWDGPGVCYRLHPVSFRHGLQALKMYAKTAAEQCHPKSGACASSVPPWLTRLAYIASSREGVALMTVDASMWTCLAAFLPLAVDVCMVGETTRSPGRVLRLAGGVSHTLVLGSVKQMGALLHLTHSKQLASYGCSAPYKLAFQVFALAKAEMCGTVEPDHLERNAWARVALALIAPRQGGHQRGFGATGVNVSPWDAVKRYIGQDNMPVVASHLVHQQVHRDPPLRDKEVGDKEAKSHHPIRELFFGSIPDTQTDGHCLCPKEIWHVSRSSMGALLQYARSRRDGGRAMVCIDLMLVLLSRLWLRDHLLFLHARGGENGALMSVATLLYPEVFGNATTQQSVQMTLLTIGALIGHHFAGMKEMPTFDLETVLPWNTWIGQPSHTLCFGRRPSKAEPFIAMDAFCIKVVCDAQRIHPKGEFPGGLVVWDYGEASDEKAHPPISHFNIERQCEQEVNDKKPGKADIITYTRVAPSGCNCVVYERANPTASRYSQTYPYTMRWLAGQQGGLTTAWPLIRIVLNNLKKHFMSTVSEAGHGIWLPWKPGSEIHQSRPMTDLYHGYRMAQLEAPENRTTLSTMTWVNQYLRVCAAIPGASAAGIDWLN